MGNRFSRKKRAFAAEAVPSQKAALGYSSVDLPHGSLFPRKAQDAADNNENEQPLSARQVPPTARDDDGNEDPFHFFQQCYALDEDPFILYTQALLLKEQRQFTAASELLRSLLSTTSLTLEVRYHLAQCLISQNPALTWCREEAQQCLEDIVAVMELSSNNADAHYAIMYRKSLELLAHVLIAGRRFDRALQLLETLQIEEITINAVTPSELAAHRQQQTLVRFQVAYCRYARGDSSDTVLAELLQVFPPQVKLKHELSQKDEQGQQEQDPGVFDPLEGIELLLHVDAASLRESLMYLNM